MFLNKKKKKNIHGYFTMFGKVEGKLLLRSPTWVSLQACSLTKGSN